jgi:hypothetical protein
VHINSYSYTNLISQTSTSLSNRTFTLPKPHQLTFSFELKYILQKDKNRYSLQEEENNAKAGELTASQPSTSHLCIRMLRLDLPFRCCDSKGQSQTRAINHCSSSQFCGSIASEHLIHTLIRHLDIPAVVAIAASVRQKPVQKPAGLSSLYPSSQFRCICCC